MDLESPEQSPSGRATMSDVARVAGGSIKSVSRVINDELPVSAKLREKVKSAIATLDYIPNPAARSLAGTRTFVLGILFDNPSPHYTIKIQKGAYKACVETGYHLRIDHIDSALGKDFLIDQLSALLRHSRTDGFVLTPPLTDNRLVLDHLDRSGLPYIRIAPVIDHGRSPEVRIDDTAAAATAAQFLWDKGHRRFGLINGPAAHGAAANRRRGFLERIDQLAPGATVMESNGDFSFASGLAAGRDLLATAKPPSAIFAANDDMAAGLMVACAERGLQVPRAISIIGFDDSWIATSVWPYLTTIHQPIEDMAYTAVRQLLSREVDEPSSVELDYHIVERDSVLPISSLASSA